MNRPAANVLRRTPVGAKSRYFSRRCSSMLRTIFATCVFPVPRSVKCRRRDSFVNACSVSASFPKHMCIPETYPQRPPRMRPEYLQTLCNFNPHILVSHNQRLSSTIYEYPNTSYPILHTFAFFVDSVTCGSNLYNDAVEFFRVWFCKKYFSKVSEYYGLLLSSSVSYIVRLRCCLA
jgi:hypothetical protein